MTDHQQPEVNYLPRFSPLLICLERSPLRGDRSREIDLFENLDIVHIRLLVGPHLLLRAHLLQGLGFGIPKPDTLAKPHTLKQVHSRARISRQVVGFRRRFQG